MAAISLLWLFVILHCSYGNLAQSNSDLEKRINIVERQINDERQKNEESKNLLQRELHLLKEENKILRRRIEENCPKETQKRLLVPATNSPPQDNYVSFYARLMKAYTAIGERETVIFDNVVTNTGNAYDVNNGIFFCPISGTYMFAATVVSDGGANNKSLDAEMVHQGTQIARLHATVYGYDEGTQVAIIQCSAREKVWIRHLMNAGDAKSLPGGGFSSFSGALLHAQ